MQVEESASREGVRVDKKFDQRRSASRERESREGVCVEKECEKRRSASREGVREERG